MLVRIETEQDWPAVRAVNESAFETPAEANLVEELRRQATQIVSLVAVDEGSVVGHILFSPVILTGHPDLGIAGLAPMAVSKEYRNRGVGSSLVRAGLDECGSLGFGAAVVLGHPRYYPRFGFAPAAAYGIACEFDVPEEAFMVVELKAGYLHGAAGTIRYHPAFARL